MVIMDKLIVIFVALTLFLSCCFSDTNIFQNNRHYTKTAAFDSIDVYKLIQNKWYFVVAPECVSYITFQQNFTYEEDNCEWGLGFNGTYEISKDSIILYEYDLASDLPNENKIVNTHIYTYVYQRNRLKLVSSKKVNEDGTVAYISFPNSVFYYRFDD